MAALTFTAPEQFEKGLVRVTAGAALGGAAAGLLSFLPLPALLLPMAAALVAAGEKKGRVLLALIGAIAGAVATASTVQPVFYLLTAGAMAGCGLALARFLSGSPRDAKPGTWAWVGAATMGALALAVGHETVSVFDSHGWFTTWFGEPVPSVLAYAARAALTGFFFSLSAAALHLQPGLDAVEQLYLHCERELSGELARLASQAVELYRKCRDTLTKHPQSTPAQSQLKRSLEEVTTRALELARRWHGVDQELGERAETEVERRLAEVRGLAEKGTDAAAKRQLQAAEKALLDEQSQIRRIRAGRERVVARLHADLAILERTRFALLAIRSTDAHLKAAELSTLSDNLSALGKELDVEAQAIDEALRSAMTGQTALPIVPDRVVEVASPTSEGSEPNKEQDVELVR